MCENHESRGGASKNTTINTVTTRKRQKIYRGEIWRVVPVGIQSSENHHNEGSHVVGRGQEALIGNAPTINTTKWPMSNKGKSTMIDEVAYLLWTNNEVYEVRIRKRYKFGCNMKVDKMPKFWEKTPKGIPYPVFIKKNHKTVQVKDKKTQTTRTE